MIKASEMSRILCLLRAAVLLAVAGYACPASADTIGIKGVVRSYRAELADTKPAPLVCARADLFAAAASVIFNLTDEMANACHPSRAVPMLMMNGTADPLIPYQGGRGTSRFAVDGFWSTDQTVGFWRHNNGCEAADAAMIDLPDRDPDDASAVTRISSHCPKGRDVVLYRINNGGHRMPGRLPDVRFPRIVSYMLGPQNHDIDGAETIREFFKGFPR
jgi:polyhydroxybutyrate depolymerase